MNQVTFSAPAKINLTLDVGPRRADGYHDIRSVMQTIALHDTLSASLTPGRAGMLLEVVGEEAEGVPADESNLVHKAAVRLQKLAAARGFPPLESGLRLRLHKRIPSQAGLGGGSSDAAAALLAVSTLLELALPPARLGEIGAALGADVPFFLTGGTALAEGAGEQITPLPPLTPSWPLVVVKPDGGGVSTAAAYAALDAAAGRRSGTATAAWLAGSQALFNDFEAVVLPAYPQVAAAYARLLQAAEPGGTPLLCGSGAAVFLRAGSREAAERVAAQVRAGGIGKVWVTETMG